MAFRGPAGPSSRIQSEQESEDYCNPNVRPAVLESVEARHFSQSSPRAPSLEEQLGIELPGLLGFLRRLLGREAAEADDLGQEVAARALTYRGAFEAGRPLGPWLRRTALRVVIDHRTRVSRMPAGAEQAQERADPASSPAERSALRDEVEHLLGQLSEIERRVLLLFHRDGASTAEIARDLDLPVGTVKSHLHRARRQLASRGGDQ